MGLLEKAGQIESEKPSEQPSKVSEPEKAVVTPEPVAQPEPVKTKKEKRIGKTKMVRILLRRWIWTWNPLLLRVAAGPRRGADRIELGEI